MKTRKLIIGSLSCFTAIIGAFAIAHAAVSYDVANESQMFLNVTITNTQTTGITIAAPQWNGTSITFATTTGGILRIRQGFKREDVLYTSATVNSSTQIITLAGVTRNICPNIFFTFVSCGTGQQFSKGATVELIQDARLFNLKANKDRHNLFTASGAITFSGSGSLSFPVFANTTSRDHNLSGQDGQTACSTADGVCYFHFAGGWSTFGTSATPNASTSVAGKVQLGSIADQIAKTGNGSAGAPTVVQTQHLTQSGSQNVWNNTRQAGRIPILNASGALSATLGGLGTGNIASGSVVIGQGSGSVKLVAAGSANNVLTSDGKGWKSAASLTYVKPVFMSGSTTTATGASTTVDSPFNIYRYTIPANDLINGVTYKFRFGGTMNWAAGLYTMQTKLGSTIIGTGPIVTPAENSDYVWEGTVYGTAAAGGSVSVREDATLIIDSNSATNQRVAAASTSASFATNGSLLLNFSVVPNSSNASNSVTIKEGTITKVSTTPF